MMLSEPKRTPIRRVQMPMASTGTPYINWKRPKKSSGNHPMTQPSSTLTISNGLSQKTTMPCSSTSKIVTKMPTRQTALTIACMTQLLTHGANHSRDVDRKLIVARQNATLTLMVIWMKTARMLATSKVVDAELQLVPGMEQTIYLALPMPAIMK